MSDWHWMSVLFYYMDIVDLLILGLATWRLSSLVSTPGDDGPWEMFMKFRKLMGVEHDENTGLYYGKNVIAQGLTCVFCVSVWIGVALGILYLCFGDWTVCFSMPFALSSAAIIVERIVNG